MSEGRRLMADGDRLRALAKELHDAGRSAEAFDVEDQVDAIHQRYRDLLPDVTVARSPDSGEVVRWPVDTMGLDAWYWNYHNPMRRIPDVLPRTWLAMGGAMRLTEPVERPPFTVVPGPDVPFVVPELLSIPGVRAVVAEVPVGTHTGWAITYFGPLPDDVTLVNLWGSGNYLVHEPGGWVGWDRERPSVSRYDFDLTGWLRSGRLLWLEPGDESATLREGPDGCPFVGLPGRRRITVIANGVVAHHAALPG